MVERQWIKVSNVLMISRLVVGVSTRWHGFDLRLVHLGFVVDEVALEQGVFCLVLLCHYNFTKAPDSPILVS